MTIAAGFCFNGGVLLCSDSQFTIGNAKIDGMKIGRMEGSWGQALAVCAGNVDYATAAFQECQRRQEYKDFKDDPIAILATTLEDYYRRNVWQNPYLSSGGIDFDMLWAVRLKHDSRARLYRLHETAFRELGAFDCIGAGEDIARDIASFMHHANMPVEYAVGLAGYCISLAKRKAAFCGGKTIVRLLMNGETLDETLNDKLERLLFHMENMSGWFMWQSQKFLMGHFLSDDATFDRQIDVFKSRLEHLRNGWKTIEAGQSDPLAPKADQTDLPPWPGLYHP